MKHIYNPEQFEPVSKFCEKKIEECILCGCKRITMRIQTIKYLIVVYRKGIYVTKIEPKCE